MPKTYNGLSDNSKKFFFVNDDPAYLLNTLAAMLRNESQKDNMLRFSLRWIIL